MFVFSTFLCAGYTSHLPCHLFPKVCSRSDYEQPSLPLPLPSLPPAFLVSLFLFLFVEEMCSKDPFEPFPVRGPFNRQRWAETSLPSAPQAGGDCQAGKGLGGLWRPPAGVEACSADSDGGPAVPPACLHGMCPAGSVSAGKDQGSPRGKHRPTSPHSVSCLLVSLHFPSMCLGC